MAGFGEWIKNVFDESPAQMAGAVAGFVCAILVITIGFWNTMLVVFFTLAGIFGGCLLKHGGDVKACLERFRRRRNG